MHHGGGIQKFTLHTYIRCLETFVECDIRRALKNQKVKVKCTLVQALRVSTGRTAYRGSRGTALLFLDHIQILRNSRNKLIRCLRK